MGGWIGAGVLLAGAVAGAQGLSDEPTLHEMAARDDVAGLARAINAGAPVDARDEQGRTALHIAAAEGHLFAAMMLVAKGADPNARDARRRTPLHLAADGDGRHEGERFQIVKLLVAEGGDRAARDADGKRPVDYATVPEFKDELEPDRPPSPRTSRRSSS